VNAAFCRGGVVGAEACARSPSASAASSAARFFAVSAFSAARVARLSRRQGRRARYRGVRKNLFDVRRTAAVQNLEIVHRRLSANDNHQRIAA
jgi:hypothetical protein